MLTITFLSLKENLVFCHQISSFQLKCSNKCFCCGTVFRGIYLHKQNWHFGNVYWVQKENWKWQSEGLFQDKKEIEGSNVQQQFFMASQVILFFIQIYSFPLLLCQSSCETLSLKDFFLQQMKNTLCFTFTWSALPQQVCAVFSLVVLLCVCVLHCILFF